jgi:hypothetical protein
MYPAMPSPQQVSYQVCPNGGLIMLIMALSCGVPFWIVVGSGLELLVGSGR